MLRPRRPPPTAPEMSASETPEALPVASETPPEAIAPAVAELPDCPVHMPILGPPPLLEGEDSAAYGDLLARISAAVKPADIFEEIWLREFLDLAWEALRYRRLKAAVLNGASVNGLADVLRPLIVVRGLSSEGDCPPDDMFKKSTGLARLWAARNREAVAEVDALLAGADLTMDAVYARGLVCNLDQIERIERIIVSAEARRNGVLREIERHRATLGRELKRVLRETEDAEFTVIEPGSRPEDRHAVVPA
jgi:hypothetical protein